MPDKMKQFLIVKLIDACFNMLIVDFAELAVQFFKDVREVDGDVVGFHILQVSDIRVVDIREILHYVNFT